MSAEFAIEEAGSAREYHRVHTYGCRDLKDANPIGEASNWDDLLALTQYAYGDDEFDSMAYLKGQCSPCVAKALKG